MRPAEEARTEVSLTHTEPVRYVGLTPDGRAMYEWRDRIYVEVKLPSAAELEPSIPAPRTARRRRR